MSDKTVFGDWRIVGDAFRQNGATRVPCKCVCGTTKNVLLNNLKRGKTTGCGCRHGEKISAGKTRHGLADTPEHTAWMRIRQRCNNPKSPDFKNYGARGIFVCSRWERSFESFLSDMGPRPSKRHSIDRINNDGPYSPENCRWATKKEQNRNRRSSLQIIFRGEARTLVEISELLQEDYGRVYRRYAKGLPLE